MTFEDIQGHR